MLSAIVLAAGSSKRMNGNNKLLLPFAADTVIECVVKNIVEAGISEVIIVTGFEKERIEKALQNYPLQFVHNAGFENGMTTSIQCGVQAASGSGYMICLSDMALITADEYKLLKEEFEKKIILDNQCICIPVFQNQKGNPVIFSSFYKEQILGHTETEGCKKIVQENKDYVYEINMPAESILKDMDNADDYDAMKNYSTSE